MVPLAKQIHHYRSGGQQPSLHCLGSGVGDSRALLTNNSRCYPVPHIVSNEPELSGQAFVINTKPLSDSLKAAAGQGGTKRYLFIISNFLRNLWADFQSGCPYLQSH